MKHTLRYCFILLALATTGVFSDAATDSAAPAGTGHHRSYKVAKKGHRRHQNHKRHKQRGK